FTEARGPHRRALRRTSSEERSSAITVPLAPHANRGDTRRLMGGRSSRASGALLACVVLSTTACVAIAGVSDKAVDPCFDGCGDAGNSPSSNDEVILEEGD